MTKKMSRITSEILEMAEDMKAGGLLTPAEFEKITIRHLGIKKEKVETVPALKGEEIRALREQAHMSQAVFARYLNVTVGYVSQLEREVTRPKGPMLALLNIIRRKGMQAIL